MKHYKNDSNSAVIILHEIYGINEHIKDTCEKYYELGFDVFCPNLFNEDIVYNYEDGQKAYEIFYNSIGFKEPALKLKNILIDLRKNYKFIYLVGYNEGATIAWLNSENYCDGCVCYYGLGIKEYLDVLPKKPTLLIVPKEKKSGDVVNYIKELEKYQNVNISLFHGKHGFADNYSVNYDDKIASLAWEKSLDFIKKVTENNYYKKK